MSDESYNTTKDLRLSERAADEWIGRYTWAMQAGLPDDMNRVLRAMWIHGYMAALKDQRDADMTSAVQS